MYLLLNVFGQVRVGTIFEANLLRIGITFEIDLVGVYIIFKLDLVVVGIIFEPSSPGGGWYKFWRLVTSPFQSKVFV